MQLGHGNAQHIIHESKQIRAAPPYLEIRAPIEFLFPHSFFTFASNNHKKSPPLWFLHAPRLSPLSLPISLHIFQNYLPFLSFSTYILIKLNNKKENNYCKLY